MLEGDNTSIQIVRDPAGEYLRKVKASLQRTAYCWCTIRKSDREYSEGYSYQAHNRTLLRRYDD